MTIAELRLYSYGIDRTRGDVPIFATAAAEAAAGGGTGVTAPSLTFSSVKVRRDPYPQTVEVSIDASNMGTLELCDTAVMKIGSIDRWYWITGYEEITNSAYPNSSVNRMNVRISLDYIPVTTGLTLASKVDILPERLPAATPRMVQNWTESIMIKATPAVSIPTIPNKLPKIKNNGYETPLAWVTVYYASNTLFSDILGAGFFVGLNNQSTSARIRANTGQYDFYPSLSQLFDDELLKMITPLTGVEIIGINISEFCPFEYTIASYDANNQYILINNNGGTPAYQSNNDYIGDHYKSYNMTPGISNFIPAAFTSAMKPKTGTITLTPSSFEIANGQYVILDSFRNKVAMIPRELMSSSMSIDYMTFSVLEGTYTILKMGNWMTTLRSTVFPWTTSSWVEYRNFNMQYDRQALQNNIDFANKELENALIDGAANGIIGGSLTGALTGGAVGAGLGAFTGILSFTSAGLSGMIKRDLTIEKLRRDQELTEQRMRNGPITLNNFDSGLSFYEMVTLLGGAEIILEMPADFTETEWTAQTATWGYPSNKVKQSAVVLTAGYWKGRITAFTDTNNNTSSGELSNLMVEQFDNGLRLKQVS